MNQPSGQALPDRIRRLHELAYNLWWSWQQQGSEVFRALDERLWDASSGNPVRLLREVAPARLEAAAIDPAYLSLYDTMLASFDAYMGSRSAWFPTAHGDALPGPVAYFSMEFGVHSSLPLYAGGLGVLAGDFCKEASDLGLPFVAVGLLYSLGSFHQQMQTDGLQQEVYQHLRPEQAPLSLVLSPQGEVALARVQLGERAVSVGAWLAKVGRTSLYLLTTDVDGNSPNDRQLTAHLYPSGAEWRLQQELLLGLGGVQVLHTLGIRPAIWHANDGHTSFMLMERVREELQAKGQFEEARDRVGSSTVQTLHTALPAATDIFPYELVERYLHHHWERLATSKRALLDLGCRDGAGNGLNMTLLGVRLATRRNAVSQLHGEVERRKWHFLWPHSPEEQVPITHVTNGVHLPTWVAPDIARLYEKYLGSAWIEKHDDPELWEGVSNIPDSELWQAHLALKRRLLEVLRERARTAWHQGAPPQQVLAAGALLDPDVLTLVFARRVAGYKRPNLVLRDPERLERLLGGGRRLQIVFAGKAHPDDQPAKQILGHVSSSAQQGRFLGRIAFVEDYDLQLAPLMVQGADAWLNLPVHRHEASGTSGMKAALNAVPHLSTRDGWWNEGYNGANGWALGGEEGLEVNNEEADVEALYRLLEEHVVPLYYERGADGVPHGWLRLVKEAIRTLAPRFSARRMVKEYVEKLYLTPSPE